MQLFPHKIYTTLVSSFVARITIFNSCVYFYCYDSPIIPQRRGHQDQDQDFTDHNLPINLSRDVPTGRDPREPQINQASDLPIEPPITRVTSRPIDFPEEKSNLSLSQYPNQTPSRSHDLPIYIMRELQISQLSPRLPNQSHKQER